MDAARAVRELCRILTVEDEARIIAAMWGGTMAKKHTAAEKAAETAERIDAVNERRLEDAREDRAEDAAAGEPEPVTPDGKFEAAPVLKNQAGEAIDGQTEVPGPAPEYPKATPDGVVIDWGPNGPPR